MASKRANKKRLTSNTSNGNAPHFFQSFISAIHSKQGPRLPIMKSLYYLLVRFSLSEPISWVDCKASSNYLNIKFNGREVKVNFEDISYLSNILFKELDMMFKEFFSALHDVSDDPAHEQCILYPHLQVSIEELTVSLRCCMVLLSLLMSNQELVVEKGRALLSLLRGLVTVELNGGKGKNSAIFTKLFSRDCIYINDDCATSIAEDFVASISFLEPSNPCHTSVFSVLEVFADELLMDKYVRECFLLIDSVSSTSEQLFTCHFGHGDIGGVLEVISAHFILSLSDDKAFEKFLNRLFWQHDNDFRAPQMSLTAVLSLLLNPVVFSAPKMFHAYLILLLCDAIGIRRSSENIRLDLKLIDCYLAAFERSVILYTRHMCSLHKDGHPIGGNDSFEKSFMPDSNGQLDFESLLLPATRKKIRYLVTKFNDSWGSYLSNMSLGTKSDLVAASIAYTKESLCLFDKSCTDEILSILSCIILGGSSDDVSDSVLHTNGEQSAQDIFLLASVLKLMSCAMLQATWCLRHNNNSGSLKALKDVSSCKEYDVMMHAVGCFKKFKVSLPVQNFLCDIMEAHKARHTKSKWMLLHFSGLLSLSYVRRLDFLVKDCIFAMITLLKLFLFEEGDLDALGSLVRSRSKTSSSTSDGKIGEAMVDRKSSQAVALNFQKIRTLYLGTGSHTSFHQVEQTGSSENASFPSHMDSAVCIQEETYNGESFLKCILRKGSQESSDVDDLADFIECKRGKDYSGWLKGRQMFRERWNEKTAIYRWKRKRMAWRHAKGT